MTSLTMTPGAAAEQLLNGGLWKDCVTGATTTVSTCDGALLVDKMLNCSLTARNGSKRPVYEYVKSLLEEPKPSSQPGTVWYRRISASKLQAKYTFEAHQTRKDLPSRAPVCLLFDRTLDGRQWMLAGVQLDSDSEAEYWRPWSDSIELAETVYREHRLGQRQDEHHTVQELRLKLHRILGGTVPITAAAGTADMATDRAHDDDWGSSIGTESHSQSAVDSKIDTAFTTLSDSPVEEAAAEFQTSQTLDSDSDDYWAQYDQVDDC